MASRDLTVTLLGDDRTGKAFGSASSNASGFGSKMKDVGKLAAVAFAGAAVAGVVGLGAALVNGAKDAANMQRILAQTSAVVKSTGGAAGVTVGQIDAFATSLEKATGIEAEAIVEGQNMLLTFTNVKNGVGEGNQVFDEASTVLADMSVAMGKDMGSSAVLLGKALNDPIAGVGALSKAGVQLTDSQKATIKAMVESGDVMGAQKIILGELETQFGGSAEAFGSTLPGQLAKAKNAFGEMTEQLAVGLLPIVSTVLTAFTANIPAALAVGQAAFATLSEWWATNGPAITVAAQTMANGVIAAFRAVGGAVMATVEFFRQHDTAALALGVVVTTVMAAVAAAWTAQAAVAAINAAKAVAAWFATATASTTSATIQSKSTAQIVVGWVAHTAAATVNAAKVVAGWVATGVGAVAAGVVHAARVAAQIAGWVLLATAGAATNAARIVASWVVTSAGAIAAGAVMAAQVAAQVGRWAFLGAQSLLNAAKVAAAWLIAMGPIGLVAAAVIGVVALIVANWDTIRVKTEQLWNAVKSATSGAWDAVRSTVSGAINAVMGAIGGLADVPGRVGGWFGGARDAARGALDGLVSMVGGIPGRITGALGNLGSLLVGAGRELMNGLARGINERISAVTDKVRAAAQAIRNLLPGSPVKEGPLTSWNNGGAGKRLMAMLAGGIDASSDLPGDAMRRAVDFGDVAGMRVGGAGFVNNRLSAPTTSRTESAPMMVHLADEDRALLRAIADRDVVLHANNREFARVVAQGTTENSRR